MDGNAALLPRRWHAGPLMLDERDQAVTLDGVPVAIEPIPRRLLHALLRAEGNPRLKAELIDAGWRDSRQLSDASFYNAMKRLRGALGEAGPDLIRLEPGRGYRIAVPVRHEPSPEPPRATLSLAAGDPVPGRPGWQLLHPLGAPGRTDVWLATHPRTGERHVFKFAADPARREALRAELLCARRLREAAARQDGFVAVLDCALDETPAWLETEYAGTDLVAWTAARGGAAAIPLPQRLALLAEAASILAAAHEVGVLHGDLSPRNLLVDEAEGGPRVRLIDFAVGGLVDPGWLAALSLSLQNVARHDAERRLGTLPYLAPELLADPRPTTAADIYALGVILYQLSVGDFTRPLAAGWEAGIPDPLLREDIAAAANGDPARRLASARQLAERLASIEARRAARAADEAAARATERLRQEAEARRRRRPWMIAAAAALAVGGLGTVAALIHAEAQRREALREAATVRRIDRFLTEDLLGRGNPAIAGNGTETLMQAAQAAEPMIARRFATDPAVAAPLYLAIATALQARRQYDPSRQAFHRAIAAYTGAEGPGGADTLIASLRLAILEQPSLQPGSMDRARALIDAARPRAAALAARQDEVRAWLLAADAQLQIGGGDMQRALAGFTEAARLAGADPAAFGPELREWLSERQAFSLVKLGRWPAARAAYAALIREATELHGAEHPQTLRVRVMAAFAAAGGGDPAAALAQLDAVLPAVERVFGPADPQLLDALGTRLTALMALARYDAAETAGLDLHDRAARARGERSDYAITALGASGEAACLAGRTRQGADRVARALAAVEAVAGPEHAETLSGRVTLAECRALGGEAATALPLLAGIDCRRQGEFEAQPGLCGDFALMRALAAAQEGDRPRAQAQLEAAQRAPGAANVQPALLAALRAALAHPAP